MKLRYKIKHREQKNYFEICGAKETRTKIAELLFLRKNCFVKSHIGITKSFLEIDYRALKILLEEGEEIGVEADQIFTPNQLREIASEATKEQNFSQIIVAKNYDLEPRIWCKRNRAGREVFYTKVDDDIYSCRNLDGLISLLKGNYFLESNKPITRFSTNFFIDFGFFDVANDFFSPSKSTLHYNFHDRNGRFAILNGSRKKQYQMLLNRDEEYLKIVIDGADDIAIAMNNAGLPQQTVSLVQALLIFPIFLRGVNLGYEGLSAEAKETRENYQEAHFKKVEIEANLENFKQEICQICNLDYEDLKAQSPQNLITEIGVSLVKNKNNLALDEAQKNQKLNQIISLANAYQILIADEIEAPEIKDVLTAYTGWFAMSSMMASVSTYRLQAIINIFGDIKGLTTSVNNEPSLISQAGTAFGFIGQCFMMIYATNKVIAQNKDWQEVAADLKEFQSAKNVSELAKKITVKILQAQKDNNRSQVLGNSALAAGQAILLVGGPFGLNFNPLNYFGLFATLGGVAVSSIAELRYQMSYGAQMRIDEIENKILTRAPQFSFDDFSDIGLALKKQSLRTIFALEVLGHLRAPHFILYKKYLEQNEDDKEILSRAYLFLGGVAINRWFNNPPQDSMDLVASNPRLAMNLDDPYNLDIFAVNENDLELIWQKAEELVENHLLGENAAEKTAEKLAKKHQKIIQKLQADFIEIKHQKSQEKPADDVRKTCQKIINTGGEGGEYLQKKLLRGVANGELKCRESPKTNLPEIRKNGKKIELAKLNLTKFEESDLADFVTQKRPQKNSMPLQKPLEKKSVIARARQQEILEIKSQHLRPFIKIGEISNLSEKFAAKNAMKNAMKNDDEKKENLARSPFLIAVVADKFLQKSEQKKLLKEFDLLAKEPIADDLNQRQVQVKKQNEIIDNICKKNQKFILKNQEKDYEKNRTIFVYVDPRNQDSKDNQIIYVRDDKTGKFSLFYGEKTSALLVNQAQEKQNGFVVRIKDSAVLEFGDFRNKIFSSFKKAAELFENKKPSNSPKTNFRNHEELRRGDNFVR